MDAVQFLELGGRREMRHRNETDQTDPVTEAFAARKFAVGAKGPNSIVSQTGLERNRSVSPRQELELRRAGLRIWEYAFERRLQPERNRRFLFFAEANQYWLVGDRDTCKQNCDDNERTDNRCPQACSMSVRHPGPHP